MNELINLIRTVLLFSSFGLLAYILFRNYQDKKLNWAMFYSFLWVLISLPIVNYICVKLGFWHFNNELVIKLPFDLYFVWLVIWGVAIPFLAKGKYVLILVLLMFWVDVLFMPQLELANILTLNKYWLIGEVMMIVFVLLPSILWAKFSLENKHIWLRAVFQFLIMGLFLLILIPFFVNLYFPFDPEVLVWKPYIFQLVFMISLPGLIAVKDLVVKGKGTPFPYDPTHKMVRSGVYAYIKNPIQWSFTFVFIPLALGFESYWLLIGSLVSISYTFGVSNVQEYDDMKTRFGNDWQSYKANVPSWLFLWKPVSIPRSQIYFKRDCSFCQEVRLWLESKSPINLEFKHADEHHEKLTQVTLVDENKTEFKSVEAIAHALEHINLLWASLSWFIRLPIIILVLQTIIDSMELESIACEIKENNC